jgi:hypothetical protein
VVFICPQEHGCIAHRVLRRADDHLMLQGDHNWRPDGAYPLAAVLGTVVALERDGRLIALNRGPYRWLGIVWSYLQPLRCTAADIARAFVRRLHT